MHPWGGAPYLAGFPYWTGHDLARGLDIATDVHGTPVGGVTLDAWGGLHPFGSWTTSLQQPEYWPGRDLYQRLHTSGGVHYLVARWGLVSAIDGGRLRPTWNGYTDWGGWDILRDVALVGNSNPQSQPQPQSGGANWGFWGHAWTWSLNAPPVRQVMPLDCETAALEEALLARGTSVSQQQLFPMEHQDGTRAVWSGWDIVQWGDPNGQFVGNVYGSESAGTGYGVYAAPIAAIAQQLGHATPGSGTGVSLGTLLNSVALGYPVIIWTSDTWQAVGMRTWTAWDGATIPYTLTEHAVTEVAVDSVNGTITFNDVADGGYKTFYWGQFLAMWSSFGNMAVVVQ